MSRRIAVAVLLLFTTQTLPARPASQSPQDVLLATPTAAGALESSRRIDREMHYAGTPGDERLAQWMAGRLRAYGFRTTIESFAALVPQPRLLALVIMARHPVALNLREYGVPGDREGTRPDAGIPFNAGSASGTVTAALVDAGQGRETDYAALAAANVRVRGKIVLVQYGAEFRGLLALRAQQHGAAAIIFHNGPHSPSGVVQRGSLGNAIKIPVLPVSAAVARRLLGANARIRVTVRETLVRRRLWNTIGVLAGRSSQEVVLGGHRDAWVYGVTDNGDGISTLLETAKALGALARTGWKPRRSIVIAGWDGEELGELGSIAYVRAHADRLRAQCVAYVNMDEGESGQIFGASAAAALAQFVTSATARIMDPAQRTRSLLARWQAQPDGAQVDAPGGGSDFEAFLYDTGIPTIDSGFGGPFGVYHSAFDDLHYARTQADPGFVNHRAMAQLLAVMAYRLADEPLRALYRLSPYARALHKDVATIVPSAHAGDVAPFAAAVARFASRAQAADGHVSDGILLDAVHRLNLICYGRNGYAAVPLPELSAAVATGDTSTIREAAARAAAALDAITAELSV
ncbi:MAG: M28 family peptidase [Candidatus Tyrphobacter sp.]